MLIMLFNLNVFYSISYSEGCTRLNCNHAALPTAKSWGIAGTMIFVFVLLGRALWEALHRGGKLMVKTLLFILTTPGVSKMY